MSLLQRIIRLPFVASSSALQPLINTGLLGLGLFGVVRKNPQLQALPAHQPVVKSNPLNIFSYFIDIYKNLRDSSPDNEIVWLLKNATFVTRNLFKMIFANDSGNAVNEIPHMLAGKIEAKHIIPNTGGSVYVLALSEGTLASLGFLALLILRITTYFFLLFTLKKISVYIYRRIVPESNSVSQKDKVIDISSRNLKAGAQSHQKKEPVYLQKYIKNRNA